MKLYDVEVIDENGSLIGTIRIPFDDITRIAKREKREDSDLDFCNLLSHLITDLGIREKLGHPVDDPSIRLCKISDRSLKVSILQYGFGRDKVFELRVKDGHSPKSE